MDAYGYEYDSADGFDFVSEDFGDGVAEEEAHTGQPEGYGSDSGNGRNYGGLEESEAQPHHERVDAGGNRQRQKHMRLQGGLLFAVFLEGVVNHFGAYESQKPESHPVVYIHDEVLKLDAACPTDDGHEHLEEGKRGGHQNRGSSPSVSDGYSAGYGNCECINRQPDRD